MSDRSEEENNDCTAPVDAIVMLLDRICVAVEQPRITTGNREEWVSGDVLRRLDNMVPTRYREHAEWLVNTVIETRRGWKMQWRIDFGNACKQHGVIAKTTNVRDCKFVQNLVEVAHALFVST